MKDQRIIPLQNYELVIQIIFSIRLKYMFGLSFILVLNLILFVLVLSFRDILILVIVINFHYKNDDVINDNVICNIYKLSYNIKKLLFCDSCTTVLHMKLKILHKKNGFRASARVVT